MKKRVKLAIKMLLVALSIQIILFCIIYRTGNANNVNINTIEEKSVAKCDNLKQKAIIVIPGIAGARLYANESIDNSVCFDDETKLTGLYKYSFTEGHRLWDPEHSEGYLKAVLAIPEIKGEAYSIKCDDEGNSLFDVRPEIDGEGDQYGSQGVYNNLINSLKSQYGEEYDVIFYSYDWRRDMRDVACELENFIDESKYESVSLVCHSMGGLIGCKYMTLHKRNLKKVDKYISIATPYLGTPKVLHIFETGGLLEGIADVVMNAPIKSMVNNFPGVYTLFPTKEYFELGGEPYLKTSLENDSEKWLDYDESRTEILSRSWSTKEDGTVKDFLNWADDFNEGMFINGRHISTYVDSYYVIGYGIPTVTQTCEKYDAAGNYLGYEYVENENAGDGAVPYVSAEISGTIDKDRCYYVQDEHTQMLLRNTYVSDLVCNILSGNCDDYNENITRELTDGYGRNYD